MGKNKKIKRELVTDDGIIHEVWVEVLPAAWEKGGQMPDYSRRGKKHTGGLGKWKTRKKKKAKNGV
jgi:hypothetical protein